MASSGYRSCPDRTRHQLIAWVASVLGFVAQQVLTIVLLGTAIMSMFREACTAPHPHVEQAAAHDGRIYYTIASPSCPTPR